jgi:hypothetical protein
MLVPSDKLVPGTYDNSISGCLQEVRVLEGLLQRKMPAIANHLRKQEVDLIAVVPQWFLSLYSQDFPFEVCAATHPLVLTLACSTTPAATRLLSCVLAVCLLPTHASIYGALLLTDTPMVEACNT